jgi:hypothetical protein
MRNSLIMALAASAALGMATELEAQGRGNGNGNGNGKAQVTQRTAGQPAQAQSAREREAERERLRAQRERDAERERLRSDRDRRGDWDRQQQARRGGSPAFCRSGQGHPVHGRSWCTQKGFGLGNERWERARIEDIIFRQPRDRRRYDDGSLMNRSVLEDILGSVVLGRFEGHGRQHGSGAVTGNWLTGVDGRILQLNIGGVPFAQLVDSRGRGRPDTVLIRR